MRQPLQREVWFGRFGYGLDVNGLHRLSLPVADDESGVPVGFDSDLAVTGDDRVLDVEKGPFWQPQRCPAQSFCNEYPIGNRAAVTRLEGLAH